MLEDRAFKKSKNVMETDACNAFITQYIYRSNRG